MKNSKICLLTSAAIGLANISSVQAGELSGSFSFDANSHFISYGFDVWADGDSPNGTFNPALSLDYKLNDNWSLSTGFWLDVNSNGNPGADFETRETDVWIGATYSSGIYSVSGTFQSWQYASDTEYVFDLGLSLDTFLSPSLTFHKRLSAGASGGFNGTFLVGGLEHSIDLADNFSLSIPVNIGFALSDFHVSDSGYGYASLGLQASYAITKKTSFNFGVTYYDTDEDVVGNDEDSFFTYNAGLSFEF